MPKSKYVLAIIKYKRLKQKVKSDTFFFENGRDYKEDTTKVFIATKWDGNNWDNAEYTNLVEWYLLTMHDPKWQAEYYRKCVLDKNPDMRAIAQAMLTMAAIDTEDAAILLSHMNAGGELTEDHIRAIRAYATSPALLTHHENYKVRVLAALLVG